MGEPALRYRVRYQGARPVGWPDVVRLHVMPRERVSIDVPTAAGVRRTVVLDTTIYAHDETGRRAPDEDPDRIDYAGEITLHAAIAVTPPAWARGGG